MLFSTRQPVRLIWCFFFLVKVFAKLYTFLVLRRLRVSYSTSLAELLGVAVECGFELKTESRAWALGGF